MASKNEKGKPRRRTSETASISALHRATGLDRGTVAKRLTAAKVKPKSERAKEKLYDIREATAALSAPGDHTGLSEARRRKTLTEAARLSLKLQKERGEVVAVADVRNYAFVFVKAMHQRFSRYAKDAKRRLKLNADQVRTMETDIALIFDDLKREHPNIF
jgi:hypothetical protein